MKCPICNKQGKAAYQYEIKGLRYGFFPGIQHVYFCATCRKKFMAFEVLQTKLDDYKEFLKCDAIRAARQKDAVKELFEKPKKKPSSR